jgi:hypothetical protein
MIPPGHASYNIDQHADSSIGVDPGPGPKHPTPTPGGLWGPRTPTYVFARQLRAGFDI